MIYTQSCLRTFRKCPRLFKHVYLDLYRPIQEAEPLRFGTMWHELRDLYWTEGYAAAGRHSFDAQDGFDTSRLIAMLRGYHARWGEFIRSLDILGVEASFSFGNMAGKFDAVVREKGELWVVEEKTAAQVSDAYVQRLEIDPQCSIYFDAAERMYGQRASGIMYFVNVKPAIKPFKKTENVRLKKDGSPCANQRLEDETPEDYCTRLLETIAEKPEHYYQMFRVPRLAQDIEASREDVNATILDIGEETRWPRNNDACIHPFGGACAFLPVCANRADIDDKMLYRKADRPHEEL